MLKGVIGGVTSVNGETGDVTIVPGGSDTNIQFNDGSVFGGANVNYNKTLARTGFQVSAANALATIHVDATVGETISPPATGTYTLVIDPTVDSPATASATQVNAPTIPSTPTIGFTYIDIPIDNGVVAYVPISGEQPGSGSFLCQGQTVVWNLWGYRMVSGVMVKNPNPLSFSLTDYVNDGTTNFQAQLGDPVSPPAWTTTNGFIDGYLLQRYDPTVGTYYQDIGAATTFLDDGSTSGAWSTTDPSVNSTYPSNGSAEIGGVASYKNLGGTKYRSTYAVGSNNDANYGSAYLIINATGLASADDGCYYLSQVGYYYDIGGASSFDDFGQAGTGDISTFVSVAFPALNTSLTPSTAASSPTFNYGSGNYTAIGDNWNFDVYEYRTNTINGINYFTGTPTNSGNFADANDSSQFTISGSFTPGDGNGRVIVINNSSGVVGSIDIGAASSFTVDPNTMVSISPAIASYTGMSWAWSAYGNISSLALKYSATPNNYTATDNNPADGFVWYHQWATFGNATGNKVLETAPQGPGSTYDSVITANSYQLNVGLGSSGVSPSTLGYLATGQTRNYNVYSTAVINGTTIYSSTSKLIAVVFPNNSLYYTITPLSWAAVSGATFKVYNATDNNYKLVSGTSQVIDTSTTWPASSTLTPTAAYRQTEIIDWNISNLPGKNPVLIRDTHTGLGNGYLEFQYTSGGGSYAMASRFGYGADGNARIESYSGGLWVGPTSGQNAVICDPSGTIFNTQSSSSSVGSVSIKGQTYSYLMRTDPGLDTVFFGTNSFGFDPQALVAIKDSGSEQGLKLYSSDTGSNAPIMTTVSSSNVFLWGVTKSGKMFVGNNTNGNAVLYLGSGGTGYATLQLANGPLSTTPYGGAIEYSADIVSGSVFYGTTGALGRKRFLQDLGSGTSGYFWYSDANGYPTVSGNHFYWNGSYLTIANDVLLQGGLSLSSGHDLSITSGTLTLTGSSIVGSPRMPYVAKTANFTLTAAEYSVNCTANTFNITLPTAVSISGRIHVIKNSGTGVITILTTSAQTIDGAASGAITLNQYDEITVESNGANWMIINFGTTGPTGVVPVARGGTNIASYAIGDILYASGTTTLSKLADVAVGSYLRSGGVTTAPLWSTLILPNAATDGDIFYSNAANTMVSLAKNTSATRYLSNTGTSNRPAWAQIDLTNGVTGILPIANGGTGSATAPYVNDATDSTLTRSGSGPYTLGINLSNANTWLANVGITGDLNFSTGATRTIKLANSTSGAGNLLTIAGADAFTGGFAGGNLTLTTGSATALTASGDGLILGVKGGQVTFTLGTGANSLIAGSANRGGSGGAFVINAGAGGQAGAGTSTNRGGAGGAIQLTSGAGGDSQTTTASSTNNAGTGGSVAITSGDGGSGVSGPSNGGNGGAYTFTSGSGGQGGAAKTSGFGGAFQFTSGTGGSMLPGASAGGTSGDGGSLSFFAGGGGTATTSGANTITSGNAGTIAFSANNGGQVTGAGGTTTAGNGGALTFTAGNGGTVVGTGTLTTGTAGAISFTAGNGGVLPSAGTGKDGGNLNFTAGNGTALAGTTNNGGSLYFLPGAKSPAGTDGDIFLGKNSAGTARGNVNVPSLTASKLVLTDGSKNLISGTTANLATAGIPTVITTVTATNQSADIGSTNFTNANVAGLYRVSYSLEDTTADITAGAVTLTIAYTADAGAITIPSAALVLTGVGLTQGTIFVQLASGSISYSTTHTGLFGTARYALFLTVERLL